MADGNQGGGDAISRRFELLGKRASQQAQQRKQQEEEGLKRQFARIGGIGSGAQIRATQQAGQERAKALEDVQAQLGAAESQERQQQEEIQKGREFAREERLGAEKFAAGQARAARGFARSERLGAQQFQAMEADKQRGFSKKLFDIDMRFKNKQFRAGLDQFREQMAFNRDQLGQSKEQFEKQLELDTEISRFNMKMAKKASNKKSMTDWLMSGGGAGQMFEGGKKFMGGDYRGGAEDIARGYVGGGSGGGSGLFG